MVVGEGNFYDEFKEIIERDGLEEFIKIEGAVDRGGLAKYYSSADLFILLSEYKESFGLVYMEAQLFGVPAIGPNCGGVSEAIIDGQTGILLNDEDDLKSIIDCGKWREIDSSKCIENAAHINSLSGILKVLL